MARTHLEMLANFLILLYLVTHGVSVPREGQAHLISGFYLSIRAWLEGQAGRLGAFLNMVGRPLQA
jgi:hypothetical protein